MGTHSRRRSTRNRLFLAIGRGLTLPTSTVRLEMFSSIQSTIDSLVYRWWQRDFWTEHFWGLGPTDYAYLGTAQHPARRTSNRFDKGKSEVHSVRARRSTPPGPKSHHAAQTTCLPSHSSSSEWLDISLRSRRPATVSNRSCCNVSKARCGVIFSFKQDNRPPGADSSSRGQCPPSSWQENNQILCLSHGLRRKWF